ncbi:MAG TPA: ABC transporter permease [Candidatus Limnocylindria bacterium]|nr:ABC transporter permease [Candidatus Limnocylindria bacterium]
MSLARLGEVFRVEAAHNARRPLFWMLVLIVGFFAFMMPNGNATISSGNAAVGGTKAWITSEFAVSQLLALLVTILYAFFISVAAGMTVIRDQDLKIGEVLHSTRLSPSEYVWGKFLAQLVSFLVVLLLHVGLMAFFNHVVPHPGKEIIGPFELQNYLRPALVFGVPTILFFAGLGFAIGEWTRKPIVVFVVPVAAVIFFAMFLWDWSPSWLDPAIGRALSLIDPAGLRWLTETWLNVDRGVHFYNTGSVGLDPPFVASRIAFALIGILAVAVAARRFAATLRGERVRAGRARPPAVVREATPVELARHAGLAALAMRSGQPGLLSGAWDVARVELRELRSTPGLYLFVPVILLQTLGGNLVGVGAFDTPLLNTPGMLAANLLNTLTLLLCLLMLFYTVESLQRERSTGLAPIAYSTPIRTPSLLLGKALANTVVAFVVLLATLLGCAIVLAVQGRVAFDLGPFALVWGLLLLPTLLMWTAFVAGTFALTGNRYATYGVALVALSVTGYFQFRDKMNWVGNWDLWNVARWTDMGVFELDRQALVLNRVMAIGLMTLFVALTVKWFPRREQDATRLVHRLRPGALGRQALGFAPLAVLPLFAGVALWVQVQQGYQGKALEKKTRDYWKQNVATWRDAPLPAVTAVDLDLELEPRRRFFRARGEYRFVNSLATPLRKIPLTGGFHWDSLTWTMNGRAYEPENRSRLYVFTPPAPLQPGDSVTIGFRHQGRFPNGISRNGGRQNEFILPAGVVLTGFDGASVVPMLGFDPEIGVKEDENRAEPREYPDDYHHGPTAPFLALGVRPFSTRIRVTGPSEYRYNATGVLVTEATRNGRRTALWESDHPVRLFNVVAGRWKTKQGDGATIYYHPAHTYNVDEMLQALVSARRFYSEWFAPYPWRELRLSEFPNLATYAQGPPTNITFSEGIGFLTKSEPKSNAAFWITAHEAAHQWWANILMPGFGPGNVILSEGMSHYSTMLLTDQVKGAQQRMAFCRQVEDSYGNFRRADSERSLLKVDDSRPGDRSVIYDKAGWVFWMMHRMMGREAMLAGLQEFIATYRDGPDYPAVDDFLATMRPHTPDPAAFDAFVQQWFREVVVPEYKLSNVRRERDGAGWRVRATVRNDGTGKMALDVAAVRGERWEKDGSPAKSYRDARSQTVLGPKETREIEIRSDFEPERVVVDPDFTVLQLERKNTTVRL